MHLYTASWYIHTIISSISRRKINNNYKFLQPKVTNNWIIDSMTTGDNN